MTGWQPIETAPRGDGVMLLLWEPHSMGGFAFVGTSDRCKGEWFNNLDMQTQRPTHWMPLPPAPDRLQGEDEAA